MRNRDIEKASKAITLAENYARELPFEAPFTQFILNLCKYCRENAYYAHNTGKLNFFGELFYSISAAGPLSRDKLNLVVRYLPILIRRIEFCKQNSQPGSTIDRSAGLLIKQYAEAIKAKAKEYRTNYGSLAGEALCPLVIIPVDPGKLERVCDLALNAKLFNDRSVDDQRNIGMVTLTR